MTRKSITYGLITGLLFSLGVLYPAFVLFVYQINPLWFDAETRPEATAPKLVLSGAIALFALLGAGILPAIRVQATSWKDGARAGMLGGLVAAMTVFIIVVAPTNAWRATIPLLNFPAETNNLPPAAAVAEFQQQILVRMYTRDLPTLVVAGLVVGWLLGGLTGFARRDLRDETLTLLDAVEMRRAGRRRWFEHND